MNKINLYDRILSPLVTEKSTNQSEMNKIVFKVNRFLNKKSVRSIPSVFWSKSLVNNLVKFSGLKMFGQKTFNIRSKNIQNSVNKNIQKLVKKTFKILSKNIQNLVKKTFKIWSNKSNKIC